MNVGYYLALLSRSERELARALREVGEHHAPETDVAVTCQRLAAQSEEHVTALDLFVTRYGQQTAGAEPERLHGQLFSGVRTGSMALLRDLHDLYLMASESAISWTMVAQSAQGLRDRELVAVVAARESETEAQVLWIRSRMKQAAPQALIAAR